MITDVGAIQTLKEKLETCQRELNDLDASEQLDAMEALCGFCSTLANDVMAIEGRLDQLEA